MSVYTPNGKSLKKLLFLVSEDWYFCSHRLPPARLAALAGYKVIVATRVTNCESQIIGEGFEVIPLTLQRKGKNPISEILSVIELISIYRRTQPDVVHHVALKPVLYGSIASLFVKNVAVVNAMAGLGFVFTSRQTLARILRPIVTKMFRTLFRLSKSILILQNSDDSELLIQSGAVSGERVRLIRGSGVDVNAFVPIDEPFGVPVVLMASRLLWDKGVAEYVDAARILIDRGCKARFVLVGSSDDENPASIPVQQIQDWVEKGLLEYWGHRSDMNDVLGMANVVCLPSYREGLPKVLLEAASCQRAIVATDVPGCREIVRDGENGLLVPPRDAESLAKALEVLLGDPLRRKAMGIEGRRMVESDFSDKSVAIATVAIYNEAFETAR